MTKYSFTAIDAIAISLEIYFVSVGPDNDKSFVIPFCFTVLEQFCPFFLAWKFFFAEGAVYKVFMDGVPVF